MKRLFYTMVVIAVFALSFASCSKKDGFEEESYEKIESITSGTIKRLDDIKIVFAEDVVHKGKVKEAIVFNPKLDGSYNFVDERTFVFHPNNPYPANPSGEGSEISISVDVGLLFEGTSGNKGFVKNFIIQPPTLNINWLPQQLGKEKDEVEVKAEIETDIPYTLEKLKNVFSISRGDGKSLGSANIEVMPGSSDSSYILSVKGIKKEADDFNFLISYDGSAIECNAKDVKSYTILSKNAFEVVEHRVEDSSSVVI